MTPKDYYEILQLHEKAEPEAIKGVYDRLALKYHPDTSKIPNAKERMQEINEAYGILKNPEKRKKYDLELAAYRAQTTASSHQQNNQNTSSTQRQGHAEEKKRQETEQKTTKTRAETNAEKARREEAHKRENEEALELIRRRQTRDMERQRFLREEAERQRQKTIKWVIVSAIVIVILLISQTRTQDPPVNMGATQQFIAQQETRDPDILKSRSTYLAELKTLADGVAVQDSGVSMQDDEWRWQRSVRVINNSKWPIHVMGVFWDFSPPLKSKDILGRFDYCYVDNNLNGAVSMFRENNYDMTIDYSGGQLVKVQRPGGNAKYNCPNISIYGLDFPKKPAPICIVFYPVSESTFEQVEIHGTFPATTKCST